MARAVGAGPVRAESRPGRRPPNTNGCPQATTEGRRRLAERQGDPGRLEVELLRRGLRPAEVLAELEPHLGAGGPALRHALELFPDRPPFAAAEAAVAAWLGWASSRIWGARGVELGRTALRELDGLRLGSQAVEALDVVTASVLPRARHRCGATLVAAGRWRSRGARSRSRLVAYCAGCGERRGRLRVRELGVDADRLPELREGARWVWRRPTQVIDAVSRGDLDEAMPRWQVVALRGAAA